MVNKEELEILKYFGGSAKLENLWIKVYDDETKKDGLISIFEIFQTILKEMSSSKNKQKKVSK